MAAPVQQEPGDSSLAASEILVLLCAGNGPYPHKPRCVAGYIYLQLNVAKEDWTNTLAICPNENQELLIREKRHNVL